MSFLIQILLYLLLSFQVTCHSFHLRNTTSFTYHKKNQIRKLNVIDFSLSIDSYKTIQWIINESIRIVSPDGGNTKYIIKRVIHENIHNYFNEIRILQELKDHPFIMNGYGFYIPKYGHTKWQELSTIDDVNDETDTFKYEFNSKDIVYLLLEYIDGYDLHMELGRVHTKKSLLQTYPFRLLNLKEVQFYAANMIVAIEYIHNKGILHRDIKPENFVVSKKNGYLTLIDFSCSQFYINTHLGTSPNRYYTCVGTKPYMAPEVIRTRAFDKYNKIRFNLPEEYKKYDNKIDYWSLGIAIYLIYVGDTPYNSDTYFDLVESHGFQFYLRLAKTKLTIYEKYVDEYVIHSKAMIHSYEEQIFFDFILKLLVTKPDTRLTMNQMKAHPFFAGLDWKALVNQVMPAPAIFLS